MIVRMLVILALAVGSSAMAAPVPKELKNQNDAGRIQGLWKLEIGGGGYWKISGDKMAAGGNATPEEANGYQYSFALRTAPTPGEFDLGGGATFVGIYRFVGDDLEVAYNSGPNRPKNFSTIPGNNVHKMKRIPEGDK